MASQKGTMCLIGLLACVSVALAGCGDVNETQIVTSVSGEGSQATVSSSGSFQVDLPSKISRVELSLADVHGDLTLQQETQLKALVGRMASPTTALNTAEHNGSLSVTLDGTAVKTQQGGSTLGLPAQIPLAISINRGSGTLSLDLTKIDLASLTVTEHEGAVTLVVPETGSATAKITGGTGPLNVEVPAGASLEVQAPGTNVEAPKGYTELTPGTWRSSADKKAPTFSLHVEQHQGTIKIMTK